MSEYILEVTDGWKPIECTEEIVRCRDCKYCIANVCMSPDGDGDYLRFEVLPDGFCKWGERNEKVDNTEQPFAE